MKLQDYLRGGGNPEDLTDVKIRRHVRFPNLVLFKYGVGADFADPIVRECRGVVLDEEDAWRVVCRPFDKFFNLGEIHAAEIDWSTARVQEKLDGSLATLYCYAGAWHVATSGTPDASGVVHGEAMTFRDYFWNTFQAVGSRLPDTRTHGHMCFMFELMGPINRIVVVHEKPTLRLIAVRNRETGEYYEPQRFRSVLNVEPVREFHLSNVDEIVASFGTMSPVSQEGYVVVDKNWNRVKIKHPGYVALHHAKDGMGPKAFYEIARRGERSEVLTAFPEFEPLIEDACRKYQALSTAVGVDYERLREIPTQKEFALEALKTPYSTILFQLRKGMSLEEHLLSLPVEKVMDLAESYSSKTAGSTSGAHECHSQT